MRIKVVFVDIDHTIADAAWRDYLSPEDKVHGDWTAWNEASSKDRVVPGMLPLMRALASSPFFEIVYLTMRGEAWRETTHSWIRGQGLPYGTALLMRPVDDHTPSALLKPSMAINYLMERFGLTTLRERCAFLLEDREEVCEAFAALGVTSLRPVIGRG